MLHRIVDNPLISNGIFLFQDLLSLTLTGTEEALRIFQLEGSDIFIRSPAELLATNTRTFAVSA